ncbi:MAG: hypothetical protein IJX04_08670 [Oscillospiraceae bacterium]|nr:hypothetical protein [Oscillospiraceae bacterium]
MKYAFLILAHTDPQQLRRLVHALDDPRFDVFIHVDAKSDIADFEFEKYALRHSRLTVLQKRYRLYWGDISIVRATLALFRAALEAGDYARFITLSGLDYPIRSNGEIYDALSDLSVEFINIRPLREDLAYKVRGIYIWKYGWKIARFSNVLFRKWGLCLHSDKIKLTGAGKADVYFSSQWHALSRGCVGHLLKTLDENPRIMRFFRYSFAPDEMVIPTVLADSVYGENVLGNSFTKDAHGGERYDHLFNELPAVHYLRHQVNIIKVFDDTEFEPLQSSGKLFFRKARSGVSDKLLDMIDETRKMRWKHEILSFLSQ